MVTQFAPLENPTIDPRNEEELVEYATDRIYQASGGRLNDFGESSPARALVEGQAFAAAELLYYANQLPEGFAIAFLKIAGIQQRLGTYAKVTLRFRLSVPLGNPFTIPIGYEVQGSGSTRFATDRDLTIPAGDSTGDVTASATTPGIAGNVGAFALRTLTQPLAYLAGVDNLEPATGGTEAETLDEVKERAFAAIRRRGLVSVDDYNQEALAILGPGAIAQTIGNLGADAISQERGAVHVFVLGVGGAPVGAAQLRALQAALQEKSQVSTTVAVSPVVVDQVEASVICKLVPGSNPQLTANSIWNELEAYLTPGRLPIGETIVLKELEHLARQQRGVEYVQSITVGPFLGERMGTNYALPYRYAAADLVGATVTLIDGSTNYIYSYGIGDPD
jgi:hypothetical protein